MRTVKLNNKEYKIKAYVGQTKKIIKKYFYIDSENNMSFKTGTEDNIINFILETIWKFLVPKYLIFKPYLFYFIFKRKVDLEDIRDNQSTILSLIYGVDPDPEVTEGRELKNVNKKGE